MTSTKMREWRLLLENVDRFVQVICTVVGLGTVFLETSRSFSPLNSRASEPQGSGEPVPALRNPKYSAAVL